jgi:glutamate synthase domain-containing protein 1
MCGIVGFMNKSVDRSEPLGQTLLGMLRALGCRGPDSAGVALFGPGTESWVLQVKLPESLGVDTAAATVQRATARVAPVLDARATGAYLRLVVDARAEPGALLEAIESVAPGVELISLGHSLEILKEVGSPDQLDATYGISAMSGSHGIGHTRLSTESKVDLSHSQPFWAHGLPDVATVHNGHITNYHKLRRQFEQHGTRFYTENDSEIIGVYLRSQLSRGRTFEQALRQSLDDFDGSFSYLAATVDSLAFVKDRFGFKPLIVADSDEFVALATEEVALRRVLPGEYRTTEPAPGSMCVWPRRRVDFRQRLCASGSKSGIS